MTGTTLITAAVVALAVGACGDTGSPAAQSAPAPPTTTPIAPTPARTVPTTAPKPTTTTKPKPTTTTTPKPPTGADMFAGVDRQHYLDAKGICGAQPRRKVAADFHLPPGAHPFTVAERYARRLQAEPPGGRPRGLPRRTARLTKRDAGGVGSAAHLPQRSARGRARRVNRLRFTASEARRAYVRRR
jgi:hypothetical protein